MFYLFDLETSKCSDLIEDLCSDIKWIDNILFILLCKQLKYKMNIIFYNIETSECSDWVEDFGSDIEMSEDEINKIIW